MIASRASSFVVAAIGGLVVLAPVRCARAVVAQRAGRFRVLRRRGREGEDQGRKDGEARRMQREIRRPPQARRRLHLLRFHAGPDLRHRRPQPDAGRAEEESTSNIPPISSASGATPSPRRSRPSSNSGAQPTLGWQQVSLRTEQVPPPPAETEKVPVPVASPVKQAARIKALPMRQGPILLRMAAAFGENQRSEEAVQPDSSNSSAGQAEEELDISVVPAWCAIAATARGDDRLNALRGFLTRRGLTTGAVDRTAGPPAAPAAARHSPATASPSAARHGQAPATRQPARTAIAQRREARSFHIASPIGSPERNSLPDRRHFKATDQFAARICSGVRPGEPLAVDARPAGSAPRSGATAAPPARAGRRFR